MSAAMIVACLAVILTLGAWAGICIAEANERIDRTLEELVLSKQMTDDLNSAAADLGWK